MILQRRHKILWQWQGVVYREKLGPTQLAHPTPAGLLQIFYLFMDDLYKETEVSFYDQIKLEYNLSLKEVLSFLGLLILV